MGKALDGVRILDFTHVQSGPTCTQLLGWFGGGRIRTSFADFFGVTRERRLRMERLQWRSAGTSAQARGEATVLADYVDGRPRLERLVPVELDIALRDGQPRITRLVLFPGGQ